MQGGPRLLRIRQVLGRLTAFEGFERIAALDPLTAEVERRERRLITPGRSGDGPRLVRDVLKRRVELEAAALQRPLVPNIRHDRAGEFRGRKRIFPVGKHNLDRFIGCLGMLAHRDLEATLQLPKHRRAGCGNAQQLRIGEIGFLAQHPGSLPIGGLARPTAAAGWLVIQQQPVVRQHEGDGTMRPESLQRLIQHRANLLEVDRRLSGGIDDDPLRRRECRRRRGRPNQQRLG